MRKKAHSFALLPGILSLLLLSYAISLRIPWALPAHMQTWKETITLYRLLDEEDVTFEALLWPLRDLSRSDPERLAQEVVEPDVLALVAAHTDHLPEKMSTAPFWNAVAQLGGSLGRRGDGPPGWKPLWKGWLRVQTWLEGVHLVLHLPLSFVCKRQAFRPGRSQSPIFGRRVVSSI